MHRKAILVLALSICCLAVGTAHGGTKASAPDPADGAVGVANPLLQWTPGTGVLFHDVYLGTAADLGDADRVANRVPFAMYWHIPGFQAGVTYYWRVDEILPDGTIQTGDVWSFTTSPAIAWGPRPRDGDKWMQLDVALSWQPGMNVSSLHIMQYSLVSDYVQVHIAQDLRKAMPVDIGRPFPYRQAP